VQILAFPIEKTATLTVNSRFSFKCHQTLALLFIDKDGLLPFAWCHIGAVNASNPAAAPLLSFQSPPSIPGN
jgi:hypothetical protein